MTGSKVRFTKDDIFGHPLEDPLSQLASVCSMLEYDHGWTIEDFKHRLPRLAVAFYAAHTVEGLICNGGLFQLFDDYEGKWAREAIEAWETCGRWDHARAMLRALDRYDPGVDGRDLHSPGDERGGPFADLDPIFWKPGSPLYDMNRYMHSHSEAFVFEVSRQA